MENALGGQIPEKDKEISLQIEQISELLKDRNQYWAIEICDQVIHSIERRDFSTAHRLLIYNKIISIWENSILELIADFHVN